MRNCLTLLNVLAGLGVSAAFAKGLDHMSIVVELKAPADVPVVAMDPNSGFFDPVTYPVDIVFTNASDNVQSFPGPAIVRQIERRYRNIETGQSQSFLIGEPPATEPELIELAPGAEWTYGIGIEFPARILPSDTSRIDVELCAIWSKDKLDAEVYAGVSFDWAEDFVACHRLQVLR